MGAGNKCGKSKERLRGRLKLQILGDPNPFGGYTPAPFIFYNPGGGAKTFGAEGVFIPHSGGHNVSWGGETFGTSWGARSPVPLKKV